MTAAARTGPGAPEPPIDVRVATQSGGVLAARLTAGGVRRLVLIHAAGGSGASWDPELLQALTRGGWTLLRLDLRDSGRSSSGSGPSQYGTAELVEDVVQVLDAVGWSSAMVLGVSLGAVVAEGLARAHPSRCAGLVLVAPVQSDPTGRALGVLRPNADALLQETAFGTRRLAPRAVLIHHLVRQAAAVAGSHFDPDAARRIAAEVVSDSADLHRQLQRPFEVRLDPSVLAAPPIVDCPVLVVHGEEDPVLPLSRVNSWAARSVPEARLLLLARTGHGELPRQSWPALLDSMRLTATRSVPSS